MFDNLDRIALKVREYMNKEHQERMRWVRSGTRDIAAFERSLEYHDKVNRLLRKLGQVAI